MMPEERPTKVYRQWMSRAGRTPRDLIEGMSEAIRAAVAEAVAAEREACLAEAAMYWEGVATSFVLRCDPQGAKLIRKAIDGMQAAIRARGGGEDGHDVD